MAFAFHAYWKKRSVVPRHELIAWHMAEPGVSGHNIVFDYSESTPVKTISTAGGSPPVLTSDVLNGQPGWYFNGSSDPLVYSGSSIAWKHIFILASVDEATFSAFRGLLSGPTSGNALVSNSSGTTFFNLGYGAPFEYRKAGVAYAETAQFAPMSLNAQVIELVHQTGVSMDGIQVGKQTNQVPARNWKGYFFDELIYSGVKNDLQRYNIYRYFAMRYKVWEQQTSIGPYVFPFAADRTADAETDKENYLSEPYDGDAKALTRGSFKDRMSLPFSTREQEEFEAAQLFHAQHYPLGEFIYRDYVYNPYKEIRCRFASPFRRHGSNVTYRFNYSFDVVQVD